MNGSFLNTVRTSINRIADRIQTAGEKIENRLGSFGREPQTRIPGNDFQSEPRESNPYRKHSARIDRAYFMGTYEMFEYVSRLTREQGLQYPFSYSGTLGGEERGGIYAGQQTEGFD